MRLSIKRSKEISHMKIDNSKVEALYKSNPDARTVFDYLLNDYKRNMGTISSSHLAWLTKIKESDIKKVYRQFEELGLGKYIEGRWGHLCRFEWAIAMRQVAKVAAGKGKDEILIAPDSTASIDDSGEMNGTADGGDETEALDHRYNLRADFAVSLRLPRNLSSSEATRLADYIRTLPIA
jgi:hypothetical protein